MNPERLLALYDRIADAPDAVGRLRRLILDLAVRGKLVPQDLHDEPASELLKQVTAERLRYGLTAATKNLSDSEAPFLLPAGWVWSRIGEITIKTGSGSTPRGGREVYENSGVPFLRSQNVYDDGLRLNDVAFISRDVHARMSGTAVKPGDLLLNITGGSMGRCCRVPRGFGDANISQHVAIIRVAICEMEKFIHKLVLSPYFQAFIFGGQTGAGRGGLPKNRMDKIPVALPPLAEQRRIVAKVDELMALCDRLEVARKVREERRDRLTAASLARLNTPDPNAAAFANDAQFALGNLSAFTSRPDQIKQLRQMILSLAIRGKLVRQDPNDEPALLRTARLDDGGRVVGHSSVEGGNSHPFEIPPGWIWATVQQTLDPAREISYGVIKLGDEPKTGGIPTLRCSDVRPGFIDLSHVRKVHESIEADYVRTRLFGGEIVINIRGTLGGVALVPQYLRGFNVAREVAVVPISSKIYGRFMAYFMLSPYFWGHIQNNLRGIAYKGLNLSILRNLPVALPPITEQQRIVAKVDELMGLCDRLEAGLTVAADTRRKLLDALLAETLGSEAPVPMEEDAA